MMYVDMTKNVVIVYDKELQKTRPDKAFYLRIEDGNSVEHVDLDGAITPIHARRLASERGYNPRAWRYASSSRCFWF